MRLGEMLRLYRDARRWPLRTMAMEVGLPLSTYARIESGKSGNEIDAETWLIITNWLAGK